MKCTLLLAVILTITGFGCETFGGGKEAKSPPPPPPPPTQDASENNASSTSTDSSDGRVDIDKLPKKKGYPYGVKTSTAGLVKSPYAPDKALVDVSRFQSGNFVRCPHTGKIFVVP